MRSVISTNNLQEEWWYKYPKKENAKLKLFVFGYSGAAPNVVSQWGHRLSNTVEVAAIYLPGRSSKSNVPAIRDWRLLAKSVGDAVIAEIEKTRVPYAFYGHSFGALLAYMTVLHIRSVGFQLPKALMVGSKRAPVLCTKPPDEEKLFHDMTLEEMKTYYMKNFAHAAPAGYLSMPGVLESILPPLQADLVSCRCLFLIPPPHAVSPHSLFIHARV